MFVWEVRVRMGGYGTSFELIRTLLVIRRSTCASATKRDFSGVWPLTYCRPSWGYYFVAAETSAGMVYHGFDSA